MAAWFPYFSDWRAGMNYGDAVAMLEEASVALRQFGEGGVADVVDRVVAQLSERMDDWATTRWTELRDADAGAVETLVYNLETRYGLATEAGDLQVRPSIADELAGAVASETPDWFWPAVVVGLFLFFGGAWWARGVFK